jgi:glucose/arabinose dehydrogenase
MLKRLAIGMCAVLFSASAISAQARAAQAAAKPADTKAEAPAQKAPPEPPPLPLNIRIEVSITDQTGGNAPARKVVTMIAGDRQSTNIRSSASIAVKRSPDSTSTFSRDVTINVDARPVVLQKEPNKVNLSLGLEYFPKTQGSADVMEAGMASFSERLGLILESGKTMMISQAADPTSDRKITVEVTATILR